MQPLYAEMILTQQDVERLLADDAPDSRIAVLDRITKHYSNNRFSPREREIAEQIFRLLMKDAIITVREILAQRIQHDPSVPRDIVLHLAQDAESVAIPILTHSEVLSDADLVALVHSSDELSKLLAVSGRPRLASTVSDALIDSNVPQVISGVLENEGAEISHQAFEKIVEGYHREPEIMQYLVNREVLPLIVVERLMTLASDVVVAQLKKKYQLTGTQLQQNSTAVREDILLYLLSHEISEAEMQALVAKLHVDNKLTPSLLMTALCRGLLTFFTIAMAHLAGISAEAAKKLVADKGELGFPRFYEKARLPASMLLAAQLVLRAVQKLEHDEAIPGSLLYANRLAEQVLSDVGDDTVPYLPHFMALIRQTIRPH